MQSLDTQDFGKLLTKKFTTDIDDDDEPSIEMQETSTVTSRKKGAQKTANRDNQDNLVEDKRTPSI